MRQGHAATGSSRASRRASLSTSSRASWHSLSSEICLPCWTLLLHGPCRVYGHPFGRHATERRAPFGPSSSGDDSARGPYVRRTPVCFSAEADFVTGAVITGIGIATLAN